MTTNYGYCGNRTDEQAARLRAVMKYADVPANECLACKSTGAHACPCDCDCPECGVSWVECGCCDAWCPEHDCGDEDCEGTVPCCNFVGGDAAKGGVTCYALILDNPLNY